MAKRRAGTSQGDLSGLPLFATAMRDTTAKAELLEVERRPEVVSSGLGVVDRALGGGLPLGSLTLVAGRAKMGATSFLLGAVLDALGRGIHVSTFSERLSEEQIRARLVVLESRVNGYRFGAGFVSAEDRVAMRAARERIPWSNLHLSSSKRITPAQIDAAIFTYRPWLVVADLSPKPSEPSPFLSRSEAMLEGAERLASLSRKHKVALVLRMLLPKGQHPPEVLELPLLGKIAGCASTVILLHRGGRDAAGEEDPGQASVKIVRLRGHDIEPRQIPLRFDQRFAGLLEA